MDIIFDVDGTLMDISHRRHFVEGTGKKDWKNFNAAMVRDTPNHAICEIARNLKKQNHRILITTGRFETTRHLTEEQLYDAEIEYNELLMRPDNDHQNDAALKQSMLIDLRRMGYTPMLAFDDRDRVVKMWREMGLGCCQVAPGDF